MMGNRVAEVEGVKITQMKTSGDARGSFIKFHPTLALTSQLDSVAISYNVKPGTIRGIHFQIEPLAEEKLVSCINGAIFDVVVDLRPNSPTFGKWTSFELSKENSQQAYLPKGIAHGYQTLVQDSIVHYSLSASYSPDSSYAINPFGDLGINWPLMVDSISERDSRGIEFSIAAQKYAQSLKG
jgi:dTDP-4-dehydrorhamnose 3,5-epimerase